MRLATYRADGAATFGLVTPRGLVDLGRRLGLYGLRDFLARGNMDAAKAFADAAPDHAPDQVTFLPVVPDPAHCYCVGVNYLDHLREVQEAGVARPLPKQPSLFIRYPETFIGHEQPLVMPRVSDAFDYEAELAIIIGRGGRAIPREQALSHVAGYACFNDGSVRDWQFHSSQVTSGKNFVGTGAFGPWMVTADELGDAAGLAVRLTVNGEVLQNGSTADLIFGVAEIVSYASAFLPLQPGDVIATGTPAGVGFSRKPPRYLKAGDVCEVEIEGIGTLRNTVVKEQ